jgi:hypothetical protein
MTHTKEPWVVSKHNDGFGIAKETDYGNYWIADAIPNQPAGATEEANARRIVAAVNACKGITNEELEWIASTGGMLGPRQDISMLAEQRDELLASLKRIRGMTDADDPGSYRSDDREGCLDAVFSEALEAIAEIEAAK